MRHHRDRERQPDGDASLQHEERKNRNEGADRGGHAGDPRLAERRRVRLTDLQLVPHLLAQRAHRIAHHFLRHAPCRTRVHAFRFILQRHLFHLDFRHQANLFLLHRDLVLPDLLLALRGQIAGRSHRQRVRDRAGHARDQDDVRLHRRADHPGHQSEVCREPVVEAVHDVPQKAAGARLVPRLGPLAGEFRERPGVGGRFFGELERDFLRVGEARFLVEVEVPLYLLALFAQ